MARAVLSGGGGGRAEAVPGLAGRGQPVRLARAAEHFMKHHRRRVTSSAVYFFGDVGLPELLAEGVVQARIAEQPSLDTEAAERRPVPVGGPVVDVAGHVVATIGAGAGGIQADRRGAADAAVEVGPLVARPVLAPGIATAVAAPRRLLPLGVGRQA